MLNLKGDLVSRRNTEELRRIARKKRERARQQHLPGH